MVKKMLNIIKNIWKWIKKLWGLWLGIIASISFIYGFREYICNAISYSWGRIEPYSVPLWLFLIILLCLIIALFYIVIIHIIKNKKLPWHKYTKDKIFDINWEWEWSYSNVIDGHSLRSRCPKCITLLNIGDFNLRCSKCDYNKSMRNDTDCRNYWEFRDKVIKEIDRCRETGEYKKKLNFKFHPEKKSN